MRIDKDIDVSDDNIVLQELLEKYSFSPKQLAAWTGRAASTIYKYLSGELTIPVFIWRNLYERTLDVNICLLITGIVPTVIAPIVTAGKPTDSATLAKLIEARQAEISCERYILKILSDGKIDGADIKSVEDYRRAYPEMVKNHAQIFRAITERFKS